MVRMAPSWVDVVGTSHSQDGPCVCHPHRQSEGAEPESTESVPKALGSTFRAMSLEPEPLAFCRLVGMKPTEVMMDGRDLDHGFTRLRQVLIVLAQPPVPSQPGERALHDPTTLQGDEPPFSGRTAYHHHPVTPVMHAQPTIQFMIVILVVGLDHFQARVVRSRQLGEQFLSPLGIIDIGSRDHNSQQQPHGIHDDMTFAATDSLAPVGPHVLPAVSGLDRLTVDAGYAGSGVAAGGARAAAGR